MSAPTIAQAEWFRSPRLRTVLSLLNESGEARVVGGAVRDTLMGMPVGDVDIATTLLPDQVALRAGDAGIKCVPTGMDHGTVTLVVDGHPFEVTTLRVDADTDGRHARVEFSSDWEADALRRDLTMNGLYADAAGQVIDHVGGVDDIRSGTVRFIGDAATRIEEDYLRILRFFRFFAWYGSGRPDADGLRASARLKDGLTRLSAERVWSEMKRLLTAPDPGRALLWMRQAGVLTVVLPETEKWGIDAIPRLVDAEKALVWTPDALLRLMAIVPPDTERVIGLSDRLRLSNRESDRLRAWTEQTPPPLEMSDTVLRRHLYNGDPQAFADRIRLEFAAQRSRTGSDPDALEAVAIRSRQLRTVEGFERPKFPVSGRDLKKLGMDSGPGLGNALAQLEADWIDSDFLLDRAALLGRLQPD